MTRAVVVLVNGLPGAGKTTLARAVAQILRLPLFSKDTIKEAHADVFGTAPPPGWPQRRWNAALGAAASRTMWGLLADAPAGAVLEPCWPVDVQLFADQGGDLTTDWSPLEIWCDVPLEVARRRFEARYPRHAIHGPLPTDAEWERWRQNAQPLQLGPALQIDTTVPVDARAVAAWINQHAPARNETASDRAGH